jgi:hypothetical protein
MEPRELYKIVVSERSQSFGQSMIIYHSLYRNESDRTDKTDSGYPSRSLTSAYCLNDHMGTVRNC